MNDPEVTMPHALPTNRLVAHRKALEAAVMTLKLTSRVPLPLKPIADQAIRAASSVPGGPAGGSPPTGRRGPRDNLAAAPPSRQVTRPLASSRRARELPLARHPERGRSRPSRKVRGTPAAPALPNGPARSNRSITDPSTPRACRRAPLRMTLRGPSGFARDDRVPLCHPERDSPAKPLPVTLSEAGDSSRRSPKGGAGSRLPPLSP